MKICALVLGWLLTGSLLKGSETVWLTDLDLAKMRQSRGKPEINQSFGKKPLSIGGQKFEHGVGTHAKSLLWLALEPGTESFHAFVGVDDDVQGEGSVLFSVCGDGRVLWTSGVLKKGQKAKEVALSLRGINILKLVVGDGGDGTAFDHADWAEAQFTINSAKPHTIPNFPEKPYQVTPKPTAAPRLNGPLVYGCRPGHPFLYRVPCQGERPITFQADSLPSGLLLEPATGIISGEAPARGEYQITLHARNSKGDASRGFKILAGDTLALTPPMGWNHWYAHYDRITDGMVRQAADVMVGSGLADVGYEYVNIDDCWMNAEKQKDPQRVGPARGAQGNILPNQYFPDMRGLTDFIHAKGLKAGIYSSPGPTTCGGFTGSYGHEAQDAIQFTEWGFDFLKYDWCSYSSVTKGDKSLQTLKKPYELMGDILKEQTRDVVFNLCQYGMGNVWEWGEAIGGDCWRTSGDLGFELDAFFDVAAKNTEHRAWSRPGAWNDPDYIQIGYVGTARGNGLPEPCSLTPNEQYSFMSLWCLMAAPLFYSGDMSRLDDFTLNVLGNPEVIEVDQDPLGQSAAVATITDETFLLIKDLHDGSRAVGLFNRGELPCEVVATWAVLGLHGQQLARDLWRQKELGSFRGQFKATVPRHGVVLVRLAAANHRP